MKNNFSEAPKQKRSEKKGWSLSSRGGGVNALVVGPLKK